MKPITATEIIKLQKRAELLLEIDAAIINIRFNYTMHIPLLEKLRELIAREE